MGDGVFEMRIVYGPGYRLYYVLRGSEMVLLLVGVDKFSQHKDVVKAKKLNQEYK
ncbi:type II toxin-antitoxin system RelE/ParE family toxin [Adlercreutzia agrestimuris]|uniref:type II toxin-antitoxin system RelE/ParE family toxin n=1 Tax=Adlercreutzia agrestimuris TaxID=2941324 RepID=UPI003B8495BE